MTTPDRSPQPPQSTGQSQSPRERYGWRDPAKHEWTAGDIAFGWLIGAIVVLIASLVMGVLMAGPAAFMGLYVGAFLGLPTLTLYGVPVAIAAAAALRRVENEFVHAAVFALLGALGGALAALVAQGEIMTGWVLAPPAIIVGALTAGIARVLAHDRALRKRGSSD